MNLRKKFGARIVELRKKHHLTQQQLADLVGFKLIGISQIERGLKFASEKTIQKLCTAFECKPQDLFNFEAKRVLTEEEKIAITDIKSILENHPEHIKDTLTSLINKIENHTGK